MMEGNNDDDGDDDYNDDIYIYHILSKDRGISII